jgi:hypothetical protein
MLQAKLETLISMFNSLSKDEQDLILHTLSEYLKTDIVMQESYLIKLNFNDLELIKLTLQGFLTTQTSHLPVDFLNNHISLPSYLEFGRITTKNQIK